jgi:hypothetical protein
MRILRACRIPNGCLGCRAHSGCVSYRNRRRAFGAGAPMAPCSFQTNGSSAAPACRPVGDFSMNLPLHPVRKFAACPPLRFRRPCTVILDPAKGSIASRVRVAEAFYGLAFSRDGARLFCPGSASETIHTYYFAKGQLTAPLHAPFADPKVRGIPVEPGLGLIRLLSDQRPSRAERQDTSGRQWQGRGCRTESAGPSARSQVPARHPSIHRRSIQCAASVSPARVVHPDVGEGADDFLQQCICRDQKNLLGTVRGKS